MATNNFLNEYFDRLTQKIDWLVTTCSSPNMVARESAKEHLNITTREILAEVYEVGFLAGKKEAGFDHDQRFRVHKYKLEEKLRKELKKEILDIVLKEYGLKDEKNKSRIIKKVLKDEDRVEEGN